MCARDEAPKYRPTLLTKLEVANVVADLFPSEYSADSALRTAIANLPELNAEQIVNGSSYKENNSGIMPSDAYLSGLLDIADLLYSRYAQSSAYTQNCGGSDDAKCYNYVYQDVIESLWRRPLTELEAAEFQKIMKQGGTIGSRVNTVFTVALTSPQFYYKNYLPKDGHQMLAHYENYFLASRLSFFLYNSVPDEELYRAAGSGALSNTSNLVAHVDRLLQNPVYMSRFIRYTIGEWIQLDQDLLSTHVVTNQEGVSLGVSAMAEQQYLQLEALFKENANLSQFLYGSNVFMNKATAKFLGLNPDEHSDNFSRVPASAAKNLYASYFASPHFAKNTVTSSTPTKTRVTARGIPMVKDFLCGNIPVNEVSPELQNSVLGPNAASLTQIQVARIRSSATACSSCHKDVDRVGAGMEFVDAFGKPRFAYPDSTPIQIHMTLSEQKPAPITSFDQFLQALSGDERLHACFVKKIATKVAAMHIQSEQPCVTNALKVHRGQGLRDYIKTIVGSKFFDTVAK